MLGMLGVIIILAIVLFVVLAARSRTRQKESCVEEEAVKPSAVLKMDSVGAGDTLICRDNAVYLASSAQRIGYYQNEEGEILVYCNEDFRIGEVYTSSGDVICVFELDWKLIKYPHLKETWRQHGKKNTMWRAAEAIKHSGNIGGIIDYISYEPLGHFEGDRVAAAAAFICWAYQGYGNPYSDYYII